MLYASGSTKDRYVSKKKIPVGKVEIYDTTFSVPSHGFRVEFYEGKDGSNMGPLMYAGNDSKIMEDWGEGVPPSIHNSTYQVKWLGYFYARFSGVYRFAAYCPIEAYARMHIRNAASYTPDAFSGDTYAILTKDWQQGFAASGNSMSLTAGTWYPIMVEYWCSQAPSFMAVLHREPDGVVDADGKYSDYDSTGDYHNGTIVEEWKVLSAGNVNYDPTWVGRQDAAFLNPVRVPVMSIKGERRANEVSEYSFEIDFTDSSVPNAYSYNGENMSFQFNSPNMIGSTFGDATMYTDKDVTTQPSNSWELTNEKQYFDWCKSAKNSVGGSLSEYFLWEVHPTTNTDHTFSAWVYATEDYTADPTYKPCIQVESAGSSFWYGMTHYDITKLGTWQRLSLTAVTDGTGERVRIICYNKKAKTGSVYFTAPMWETGTVPSPFSTKQQRIRKFRLVTAYMGYQNGCNLYENGACSNTASGWFNEPLCSGFGNPECPYNRPSSNDYMQKFSGRIVDFDINRGEIENKASIICHDFQSLLINALDENYPDTASYMAAQYKATYTDGGAGPNGLTRPKAYDGWKLDKVIRDLYLQAGVDSSLLYDRAEHTTTSGTLYYGDLLIGGHDTRLTKNYAYGVTNSVFPTDWTVSDPVPTDVEEAYNWKSNFGEPIIDRLTSLSDAYGYMYGLRSNGGVYFKAINTPTIFSYMDTGVGNVYGWINLDGFAGVRDIQAIRGGVLRSTVADDTATCRAFGDRFQLAFVRDTGGGFTEGVWSMFDDFIDDVVDGGYNGCSPVDDIKVAQGGYVGDVYYDNSAYFIFKTELAFELNRLKFNVTNPASTVPPAVGTVTWTLDMDIALLTDYPDDPSDVISATYTDNLITALDAFTFSKLGDITVDVSNTNLSASTYYVLRVSTNTISCDFTGSTWYSNIVLYGAQGGNEKTYCFEQAYDLTRFDNSWPDIEFITVPNTSQSIGIKVTRVRDSEVVYNTSGNLYYSGEWHYYDSINPSTGRNPSIYEVNAQDLIAQNAYLGYDASDIYDIQVKNVSGDDIRIEGVLSYAPDIRARKWGFYGGAGDISSLGVDIKPDDLRNDIYVIGARKGPIRSLDGRVLNPNNPEMEFTYARATDLDSIYSIQADNHAGFRQSFILQLPNVRTDAHAKWLSIGILEKYRQVTSEIELGADGIEILEIGDCIGIDDTEQKTLALAQPLWITSIEDSIDATPSYNTAVALSSIEPWESYVEKGEPDINLYLDEDGNPQAFVNITIETTRGDESGFTSKNGYDSYESEQQNYIKISYTQVLNGHVRIYIFPSGDKSQRNNRVTIIMPPTEGGVELGEPTYQDWGAYEVLWDGISQSVHGRPNAGNTGYYVEDGNWCVAFELMRSASENALIKIFSNNLTTFNDLNESGALYITTHLTDYPTAAEIKVLPTGCGAGHPTLLQHETNGWPKRNGETEAGCYWSSPANITCADFDEGNVTVNLSASGYHNGIFVNRWIAGTVRFYAVEQLLPDIFAFDYDGANNDYRRWTEYWRFLAGMPPTVGVNYPKLYKEEWFSENQVEYWKTYHNVGVGGSCELITDPNLNTVVVDGFFGPDQPFTRNVNPTSWTGINTHAALDYDIFEPKRSFQHLEYGHHKEHNGCFWWDYDVDGFMHYKAVVIDCTEIRDRAGRPLFQRFHYGSGSIGDAGGVGTAKEGYRLCRFDRMYGMMGNTSQNYHQNCGAYLWRDGNDWEDIDDVNDHNTPEKRWSNASAKYTDCGLCKNMCKWSRFDLNDPWFEGEKNDENEDMSRCKEYKFYEDKTCGMTQIPFHRSAMIHVIYWHDSDYTYYPFNWSAGTSENVTNPSWHSASKYYHGFKYSYAWKESSLGPYLDQYWAARVLATGEKVGYLSDDTFYAEPGQELTPQE